MSKKTKEKCDCDNPGLPVGRCFLCGNPCEHASNTEGLEFTVGPCCFKKVRKLYKREAKRALKVDPENGCEGPGWVTSDGDDTFCCIQKDDSVGLFEFDNDAAMHVACALGVTKPAYPEGA